MQKNRISAGTPQRMAWAKAVAPGTISGAMPNAASASGARLRNANISSPRPAPSHSAWRNSGAIASRRPLPSSCETEAVSAIRVPIGTIIGSHSRAVPTVTEARVRVPWRPAMTLSTKLIRPVDTCPSTSGRASVIVASSSGPRRRPGGEDADMGDRRGSCGRAGGTGTGLRGLAMLPLPTPRHHAVHEGHPRACANCSTELHGEYCHHCGQHAHNPVRSFAHAVEEVFESFWHLDGRIFLTLRRLLVPGRLALDYLQGRRAPYVAPMRLFVVLCVLTFFVGRLVIHLGDEPDGQGPNLSVEAIDRSLEEATTVEEVERIRSQRVADLEEAREALPPYLEPARVGMDRTISGLHAQAER